MKKIILLALLFYSNALAVPDMTVYNLTDSIPLSFTRNSGAALVSGLTVSVTVKNAKTGGTLLGSTSCPEVGTSSGIYTYNWSHGLTADTPALVTYTVGSQIYTEFIFISFDLTGGSSH